MSEIKFTVIIIIVVYSIPLQSIEQVTITVQLTKNSHIDGIASKAE